MERPSFLKSLFGFKGKVIGITGLALVAALNFGAHTERVVKVEKDCQTVYSQLQKEGTYNYNGNYKEMTKPQRLLLMATAHDLLSGENKNLTPKQRLELKKILVAGYRGSNNPQSKFEGELHAIENLVENEWGQFNGNFEIRSKSIDDRIKFIKNLFSNLMHEFEAVKDSKHTKETFVKYNEFKNKNTINDKTFSEAPALIIWYIDLLNTRIGLYQCENPSDTSKTKYKWAELDIFLKDTEKYFENLIIKSNKQN
jgi:hypothetical protein